VERLRLERENARLRAASLGATDIIGESDLFVELKRQIERVAPTAARSFSTRSPT
jgi:DNA-binding NtrC family response regulator